MRQSRSSRSLRPSSQKSDIDEAPKVSPEKASRERAETLGDYEQLETIGTGNFGTVVRVRRKTDGAIFALKIIPKSKVELMKQAEHIVAEAVLLQTLRPRVKQECPSIVELFSKFKDNVNVYLLMEYIEGCTLLSQIRTKNPKVVQNMQFYAVELLQTLEFLHSLNIIFRDLKPENILISMAARGHVKLVDFGFAKELKSVK